MKFCEFCDNMLYIKSNEDDNFDVRYYCKNCNFEQPLSDDQEQSTMIIQNRYNSKDDVSYKTVINENIVHDPTVPHIDNLPCPNTNCTKPEGASNDVMYIKVDNINLKFVYYCTYCKHFWENNVRVN